ncbi:MAG: hypothetical protein Q8R06_11730 [Polaromonas sp.]|uniref:hypothetical protein n=1 Tax=Polaromonas sp. TaxID=1869339 RepID=UPI002737228D|nr:hypothetical protein [Polaromonas sp.]MDP3797801.1 hypothetical protein [Polaromonas sp.]
MSTAKRTPPKSNHKPIALASATVSVHDLVGTAAIAVPHELKEILGEQAYREILNELEDQVMIAIIRRPHHIVYLYAKLAALELDPQIKSPAPDPEADAAGEASSPAKPAGATNPRTVTLSVTNLPSTKPASLKQAALKAGKSAGSKPRGKA